MAAKRAIPDQEIETEEAHYHVGGREGGLLLMKHSHAWRPPTDVTADDDRLIVVVEIGGMKDGEIQVSLSNQRLTISGMRPAPSETYAAYHQLEVRYGDFRTDVFVPWPVNSDDIAARYEDGFLRVELPRAKPPRVRVVDVDKR